MSTGGPLDFEPGPAPSSRDEMPAPKPPPRGMPGGRSRYGWLVGIVAVFAIVYITLNTLRSDGPGSRGVPVGRHLPAFAAPLATSDLAGDANIATGRGEGERGDVPACTVRGAKILNVCELGERGPVVLAFLATRGGDCERQLDVIEQVRHRFPGVQFAAVSVRGDRGDLRETIRKRGWGFPIGYDRDGAVANIYGVAVCPTIEFAAYPGRVAGAPALGVISQGELTRRVTALVERSRAHGWKPPA